MLHFTSSANQGSPVILEKTQASLNYLYQGMFFSLTQDISLWMTFVEMLELTSKWTKLQYFIRASQFQYYSKTLPFDWYLSTRRWFLSTNQIMSTRTWSAVQLNSNQFFFYSWSNFCKPIL